MCSLLITFTYAVPKLIAKAHINGTLSWNFRQLAPRKYFTSRILQCLWPSGSPFFLSATQWDDNGTKHAIAKSQWGSAPMIYGAIIAAWTALNKTIRRWSRTSGVQKELILVAESNQVLRRHLVDVLRDQHYRTIEASDGADAVRIGAGCREHIYLLMTAVRLPDLMGSELEELLRLDHPAIDVVYIAHDREDWQRFGRKRLKCILLQVPFRPEAVLEVAREGLSHSAEARRSRTYKSKASSDGCSAVGSMVRFPGVRYF